MKNYFPDINMLNSNDDIFNAEYSSTSVFKNTICLIIMGVICKA